MFRILTIALCLGSSFFVSLSVRAQSSGKKSEYYTVREEPVSAQSFVSELNPIYFLLDMLDGSDVELTKAIKTPVLNLLDFVRHRETLPKPAVAYNRLKHFGTWIDDSRDQNCYNTRAKILMRDSASPVTYSGPTHCTVSTGSWHEPYSDQEYTRAADIQIDHVVPLKNAYVSGASQWNYARRCLYANYMGNDFHLMSVDGVENMKKSDQGPEGYMPPSPSYQCEYLQRWVAIKLIWSLGLNSEEALTVRQLAQDNHCSAKDFLYSVNNLKQQRNFIQNNLDLCSFNDAHHIQE